MSTKIAKFVSQIAVYFPPPRFESQEQEAEWLRSMVESLKAYDGDILDRACQEIIDTRGTRAGEKWFPLPAEIRRVCTDIADETNRPKVLAAEMEAAKANPWSRARTRFVIEQLLSGEMGKRAARDGWIGPLYDECRLRNELPKAHEIDGLKRRAEDFFAVRSMCHRREGWPATGVGSGLAGAAARLGDTIEKRNRLVASVVLGNASVELLFRSLDQFNDEEAAA
tara:strand:- start:1626 stop:2300 length:675 start_codon:yes stop_codon:yes gene_type:complete